MALETDLQQMARHFVDILQLNREVIVGPDHEMIFKSVAYGEPRAILEWPFLSVQPLEKRRELRTTRKYGLVFVIHLLLYHGEVAHTAQVQEGTHTRIEALERYVLADRKWNYVDSADPTKDKVIHGQTTVLDHPVVLAGDALWSASRLQLEAMSEEYF